MEPAAPLRPRPGRRPGACRSGGGPRGFTLLELTVSLALLAVLVGLAAPAARRTTDRWAVRSVRDRTAVALHRARVEARMWGGARLEVDAEEGALRLHRSRPDSLVWEDRAPDEHRVRVVLSRGAATTNLTFDALGLGIVASRTLVFRRGEAEARLVISSRGRGRRR